MRLGQRLLLGATLLVGVTLLMLVIVLDGRLRDRLFDENRQALEREARLVAGAWRADADPDSLADATGAAIGHRVTLVAVDGRVIGDSEFDGLALAELEHHGDRPEVRAARARGAGHAVRTSASEGVEQLYVAVQAPHGVVRVSVTTQAMGRLFERTRADILLTGLAALALAVVLAWLFSRGVTRPVVELRDIARAIAAGDLSQRPALSAPGEIGDLAAALHRMAEQLRARLAALEKDEALLFALLRSLNEGVLILDARRNVVGANDTARAMLRLQGVLPLALDALPRERMLRDAIDLAIGGTATEGVELAIADRHLALTARPLVEGGAIVAMFDLTRVRRLETVRRDFVANVSHELRTPLTVVSGFAETLAEDDPPAGLRRQFAATILAHTARMQRIVDDLLDLSRIESGGWVPQPRVIEVGPVAADTFETVRDAAAGKGVALRVALDPEARTVFADPTALRQILGNLVENAVRHTPSGAVAVFTRAARAGTWLGVRDTGTGIAQAHLPRIFERFYRADPGRSREEGGTGLGLAIVKHLTDAHGGRIEAESTVGAGTTIGIFFPGPDAVTPP